MFFWDSANCLSGVGGFEFDKEDINFRWPKVCGGVRWQGLDPLEGWYGWRISGEAAVKQSITILTPSDEMTPADPVRKRRRTVSVKRTVWPAGIVVRRTQTRSFSNRDGRKSGGSRQGVERIWPGPNDPGNCNRHCGSWSLRYLAYEGSTRPKPTTHANCARVVLKARVVNSSKGSFRKSWDRTSMPQGPAYPALCMLRMKLRTSNSPSPHSLR